MVAVGGGLGAVVSEEVAVTKSVDFSTIRKSSIVYSQVKLVVWKLEFVDDAHSQMLIESDTLLRILDPHCHKRSQRSSRSSRDQAVYIPVHRGQHWSENRG